MAKSSKINKILQIFKGLVTKFWQNFQNWRALQKNSRKTKFMCCVIRKAEIPKPLLKSCEFGRKFLRNFARFSIENCFSPLFFVQIFIVPLNNDHGVNTIFLREFILFRNGGRSGVPSSYHIFCVKYSIFEHLNVL